jgi:hypothetical protein
MAGDLGQQSLERAAGEVGHHHEERSPVDEVFRRVLLRRVPLCGYLCGKMTASSTYCPGRKPPIWAVTRPARPYKSDIQNRFTIENVKGA